MGFGIKMKLKRRNLEKRKEKSRDAARTRRSRETEIFLSLSQEIPISFALLSQMDKASVIRLAITHLKIRNFCDWVLERKNSVHTFTSIELESKLNKLYYKALNGFVMVLNNTGNLIFITDNVLQHLGLSQVDLLGHSVFDFVHPCDHSELRDICGINKSGDMKSVLSTLSSSIHQSQEDKEQISFFLRMKCIRPCKGRSLSLKTNAYKVIHCSGFFIPCVNYGPLVKYSQEDMSFLVIECCSILHPSNHNIRLDNRSFISHHTMDMKLIYCDDGISTLLGYSPEQIIGTCFYEFHHALDDYAIICAYKTLFSKGQSVTGLYRFLAKSGGYAWVETQASLVKNPQTDKPQSVICINSVVTDIICKDETFGLIQQSAVKSSNNFKNVYNNKRNDDCFQKAKYEQCLYDDFVVSEISNDYQDESYNSNNYNDLKDNDDKLEIVEFSEGTLHDKSDGVMFSTERILNSAKILNHEKAGLMENDIQPYLESPPSSDCDTNLHTDLSNISSSASLFKLLKEFDDDGDEMRAPFIPMDDLIFIDNTSDPSLISTEEYDIPIFDTDCAVFKDVSKEIHDDIISCKESLVDTSSKIDYETSILALPDIINKRNAKKVKEEQEGDIVNQSSSVLMNLLVKGEDTNYGYRLMTSNRNVMHEKNSGNLTSKDSTLYQLLCS